MDRPKLTAEQRKTSTEKLNELIQETERVRAQVGEPVIEEPKSYPATELIIGAVGGILVGVGLVYLVRKLVNN